MILLLLALAQDAEPVRFARDVRPILAEFCYACHGPDVKHQKSTLRLDSREHALEAVVPGKPEASELWSRVSTSDMPPPKSGKKLDARQKDVLRRWIAQGAPWEGHWAFQAPVRPPVPPGAATAVDAFLLDRLKREKLSPMPEASPETLLRRVSLDLTGLPPTPEEVDAFLADERPDAYARQVDRLLASPRYGERMAVVWLDAARYADTHGLHTDSHRDMWPWRDWVIDAFNRNMPFDRFTVEQLAGDLLPSPTLEQRVATGFNRNHLISGQGSEIPEKVHVGYVTDRVNTTGTVWMGLSLQCAQCHDHKFDPLTQEEYYRLYAFFNSIAEKPIDGRKGNAAPVLKLPSGATTMVMEEMAAPRETRLLMRGEYDQKGETVEAGTPAVLPPIGGRPLNRLGLAEWLVDPKHPLTARVTVNRLWQMLFGTGIVATSDDFGVQGEFPVHPELLDWLAVELVESGWDVKHMLRLMVTSAAYRQSSTITPSARAKDPDNRLLSRGPRFRLPAELLRDQALAVAGLLVDKIGGPSVKPYQPAGVWDAVASQEKEKYTAQVYVQDKGESLWRRSLYTFWKRLAPPPALAALDAPSRESCLVRRPTTNTPLQALVLLNDPTFVEAARALASRTSGEPESRASEIFRRATARRPSSEDRETLVRLYRRQLEVYRSDVAAARALLAVGESPLDPAHDPAELAAWTVVASAVLNLDETLTKE